MKVFLTGGTGYLGGRIARDLLAHDHRVFALVRDRDAAASLAGCGATLVEGSLETPDRWEAALAGCEGVVHSAGLVASHGPAPAVFDRVNVNATLDLLDQVRALGIARTVVTGSLFSFPPSPDGAKRTEDDLPSELLPIHRANDYVRSKAVMAHRVRERQITGDPAMMVFPTVLLGAGAYTRGNHTAHVLDAIGRGRQPGVIGSGEQEWNLVGVDDAATGHRLALERGRPGRNYILGGEDWTQRRLVEEAARLFGRKPPLTRLGTRLPTLIARGAEAFAMVTGKDPLLTRGEVALYDQSWTFTSERARQELGYLPRPVSEVLAETVTWLRDEIWPRR